MKNIIQTKQDILGAILVSFPILIYWVYWTLHPSYSFNVDPATVYFIDSLSIFAGKSYVYVDHPGIPIQIIGSLLIAITYPFFGNSDALIRFFISRPNTFFLMAHTFLLAANIFCVTVFYRTVSSTLVKHRTLGALAISLLFFAIHPQAYQYLTFWSHNSLNYPFGTLLLIWLYRELQSPSAIKAPKLILLGFAFGVYSMVQIYFLVWPATLILVIFLFSKRSDLSASKAIKTACYPMLGTLMGITSMLIPIYKEMPRLIAWLTRIITHTGAYGTGESGFISLTSFQIATKFWWFSIRPMIVLFVLCIIVLIFIGHWNNKNKKELVIADFAMIIGLLFQITILLFVMVKASVQLRYSLPLATTLPLLIFILIKNTAVLKPWKTEKSTILFYVLILLGVVASLIDQRAWIDRQADVEQIAQKGKSQAVKKLANTLGIQEEDVVVVYANGVPLKCAGLVLAVKWTGNFRDEVGKICPNQVAISEGPIEFNTIAPVPEINNIDWDLVIWPGNGSNLPEYLNSVGAVNVPRNWYVMYPTWYFIHSEILSDHPSKSPQR